MAGCCGNTSVYLKSATFLILLGFVLFLLGYATPLWSSNNDRSEGLWENCLGTSCQSVIDTPLGDQGWFIAVQVLMTLALVVGFAVLILCFIVTFGANCGSGVAIRITSIVLVFLVAAHILVSVIVYWIEGKTFFGTVDFNLNFSWGITVASLFVYVIGGILLSVELDDYIQEKREEEEEDVEKKETTTKVITVVTESVE